MQMVEYLNLAKQPKKWSGKEGCAPLLSLTLNLVAWATDYSARLTTTFTRLLHAFHAILHATILVDRRGFEPVTWSFC